MVSRRVKILKRILQSLDGPAPLNNNKGPLINDPRSRYISRKDRKHSGRVTPRWTKGGGMKYKEAIADGIEPQEFYDDWKNIRDGQRDCYNDGSRFKKKRPIHFYYNNPYLKDYLRPSKINPKLHKELMIRRAAKLKRMKATS